MCASINTKKLGDIVEKMLISKESKFLQWIKSVLGSFLKISTFILKGKRFNMRLIFCIIISVMFSLLTFYVNDYADAHTANRYVTSLTVNCPTSYVGDSDNDGICDSWEISGSAGKLSIPGDLIAGGLSTSYELLPSQEAGTTKTAPDPTKFDIYLEIDCYSGYCPSTAVIDDLKAAFEAAYGTGSDGNINLHVQLDEQDIVCATHDSESSTTVCGKTRMTSATNVAKGYDQVKAKHFGSLAERCPAGSISSECTESTWWSTEGHKQKMTVFHYGLFVKQQFENPSSSGISEQFGNDIMISLGSFTGGVGSIDEQEGTLMHELGHNLDLDHGGPRKLVSSPSTDLSPHYGINCKPNYLSVMSYSRQMKNLVTDRDLDYSRMAIGPPASDTLVENSLNEDVGIASYATPETVVYGPSSARYTTTGSLFVDWNAGATGTVQENINDLPGCTSSSNTETLRSFVDWDNLWFKFRDDTSDYADGVSSYITDPVPGEQNCEDIDPECIREFSSGFSQSWLKTNSKDVNIVRTDDKRGLTEWEIHEEDGGVMRARVIGAGSITKEIVIDQRLLRVDTIESMLSTLPNEAYVGDAASAKSFIQKAISDAKELIKKDKFAEANRALTSIKKMLNDEVVNEIANNKMIKEKKMQSESVGTEEQQSKPLLTVIDHLTDTIKSLRIAAKFVPNEDHKARFSEGSPRQQESLGVLPVQIECKKDTVLFLKNLDDTPYCIKTRTDQFGKDPWFAATKVS